MYVLIAIFILYLSFFVKEGFNPNLVYAQKCVQDVIDSGVNQKNGEYLEDLLNLLQFI